MGDRSINLSRVRLKRRRTKIVATLGPASSTDETVAALLAAGVDVFRLNFSHGTHDDHRRSIERVRRLADRPVALLADLCGPKIRVGTFAGGGIDLADGARVAVTTRDVEGRPGLIPSQYAALAADARAGNRILLDDGNIELRVASTDGRTELECDVVSGGRLRDRKGMNLPGVAVSAPALTDKDRADAAFAVEAGVDLLALSFVRRAYDVKSLRRHVDGAVPIIAKIEKPEAVAAIGEILDAADGIMVARGDLGVEMPAEEVPILQSELIRLAVEANRPVIVATQMLESMIENPRPTRAEVTDVASAAFARADAVMLSAETAAGRHPVAAVATMDRILRLVEGYQWSRGGHGAPAGRGPTTDAAEAMSRATSMMSSDLGARAIVVLTRSGRTARMVASERPAAPILALTPDPTVCRRLQLSWGVSAEATMGEPTAADALSRVRALDLAAPGQPVLLVWDSAAPGDPPQPTVSAIAVGS